MKVIVLGGDGYCGWPTSLHLSEAGHEVVIVDNFVGRQIDHELGAMNLTPIRGLRERTRAWREVSGQRIETEVGDLLDYEFLCGVMEKHRHDAVVHFAEQKSTPYFMIDRKLNIALERRESVDVDIVAPRVDWRTGRGSESRFEEGQTSSPISAL